MTFWHQAHISGEISAEKFLTTKIWTPQLANGAPLNSEKEA
jgi:hypothetical protein